MEISSVLTGFLTEIEFLKDNSLNTDTWRNMVEEIVERGYSEVQIAAKLKVSRDAIIRMRKGITQKPRYRMAAKLFALHMQVRPDRYGHG